MIEPDGSQRLLDVPNEMPAELQLLRETLGGHLEMVALPNGLTMFVNEEGKLMEMPLNVRATKLSGLFPHDVIAGPAVIMGTVDGHGDTLGLSDEELDALFAG